MAKYYSSTMNLQAVFKSTAKAPIDNRQVVASVADLTASNTFEGFAYDGMLVIVQATGDAYILKDAAHITESGSWVKLATDSSAAAAASVVQAGDGQASYLEITSTTAQDGHKIYTVSLKPVDVSAATQANTGVADAYQVKSYVDDAISGVESIIEENEEVTAAAFNDLNDKIENATTAAAITIEGSTPTGIAKRYTISQGGSEVGHIDIPKDLVVDDGKIVDVTYSAGHYWDLSWSTTNYIDAALVIDQQQEAGYLAGKYIRLIIANSQELPLYIAAKDLVDVYTSGSASTDNVVIAINAQNQITASIGTGSTLEGIVTKVNGIAEGAQVNVIDTVKVNGTALQVVNKAVDITIPEAPVQSIKVDGTTITPDAQGAVDITTLASKTNLERVERVAASAFNDLNDRLETVEDAISGLPTHSANSYLSDAITSGNNIMISAATHGCGSFPLVQVYYGQEVVTANISVDVSANSDVTVAWEITPSAQTPIRIRIVG